MGSVEGYTKLLKIYFIVKTLSHGYNRLYLCHPFPVHFTSHHLPTSFFKKELIKNTGTWVLATDTQLPQGASGVCSPSPYMYRTFQFVSLIKVRIAEDWFVILNETVLTHTTFVTVTQRKARKPSTKLGTDCTWRFAWWLCLPELYFICTLLTCSSLYHR